MWIPRARSEPSTRRVSTCGNGADIRQDRVPRYPGTKGMVPAGPLTAHSPAAGKVKTLLLQHGVPPHVNISGFSGVSVPFRLPPGWPNRLGILLFAQEARIALHGRTGFTVPEPWFMNRQRWNLHGKTRLKRHHPGLPGRFFLFAENRDTTTQGSKACRTCSSDPSGV
jgi:hypothetical protein